VKGGARNELTDIGEKDVAKTIHGNTVHVRKISMSMDIHGDKPKSPTGKYFGRSSWDWNPLATYVCGAAPDIAPYDEGWHLNQGAGLSAEHAETLAERLQAELSSRATATYVRERDAFYQEDRDALKLNEGSTIKLADVPRERWGALCGLRVSDVEEFVAFLRDCGGFSIW
jgi:hypothetical protein